MKRVRTSPRLFAFLIYTGISVFFFRNLIPSEGVVLRCDWSIPPNTDQILMKMLNQLFCWSYGANLFGSSQRVDSLPFEVFYFIISFLLHAGGAVISKGLCILVVTLMGFSMFCLCRYMDIPYYLSLIAGLFYMSTPIVFNYICLGFVYRLLAFGILPLYLIFTDKSLKLGDNGNIVIAGLLASIMYLDLPSIALVWLTTLILSVLNVILGLYIGFLKLLKTVIFIALISFSLHLYWILPAVYQLIVISPSTVLPEPSLQRIIDINSRLSPFNIIRMWGSTFNYQFETVFNEQIVAITVIPAILGCVSILFLHNNFSKKRAQITFILFSAILMLIPMIMYFLRFIFAWNSILYSQRDVSRYLILEALAYGLLISVLSQKVENRVKKAGRIFVVGALLTIIVLNAYPWFLGEVTAPNRFFFDVRLSAFNPPNEYETVENLIANADRDLKVLWLPTGSHLVYVKYDKNYNEPFKNMADVWALASSKPGGFAYTDDFSSLILKALLNPSINRTIIERMLGICSVDSIVLRKQMVCGSMDGDLLFELLNQKGFNGTLTYDGQYVAVMKVPQQNVLPHIYSSDAPVLINGSLNSILLHFASESYDAGKNVLFLANEVPEESWRLFRSLNYTTLLYEKSKIISIPVKSGLEKPFNYSNLIENSVEARYYFGWKSVVRTDGKEPESTLSFPSLEECPYKFPSFSLGHWSAFNSTLIFIKTGSQPMAIKEISENGNFVEGIIGVWWETGWMGMGTHPIEFPIIIPANQKAIIQIGHIAEGNITINLLELNSLTELNKYKSQIAPTITFKRVNPTKYIVQVENASAPFFLVFSESYDSQWKVYAEDAIDGLNEVIAEYPNVNVKEARHEWFKFTLQDIAYLFRKPAVNETYHFMANGYANAWYINPKEIDKDGDGCFTITLYYLPQSLFYLGLIISSLTFIVCIGYLLYDWKRQRKGSKLKRSLPLDWHVCKKEVETLNLTEGSRILDVGSGDGEKASYVFSKTKGDLILSDVAIHKSHSKASFVNCDARNLPFKDSTFDVVTCFHVIEHIEDGLTVLEEIHRVLKTGGWLLLVTPNAKRFETIYSSLVKMIKRSPYKYPLNPDHVFEYSLPDLESLIRRSKFKTYEIRPIFMRFSRLLKSKKCCSQFLVRARKD